MATTKKKLCYSPSELQEFKKLIIQKKEKAQHQLQFYLSAGNNKNGTDDTCKKTDTIGDSGAMFSKEENLKTVLAQEKFILDLNRALGRIETKSYGRCRITGEIIPKSRLMLVPHATLSIEGKEIEEIKKSR